MAVKMGALLFLIQLSAWASLTDATGFKAPPPANNGCYKGRLDGSINVQAVFDMGGVTGSVQFYQPSRGAPTEINVNLQGLNQYAGSYPWHAHTYPVRSALLKDFPCGVSELGAHYDPLNVGSDPDYMTNCNQANQSACEVGDFGRKVGRLRNDVVQQLFVDNQLDLYGPNSVVGRSLVIHYPEEPNNRFICANIEPHGCKVKSLRAAFDNGVIQGDVVIRHASGTENAKIFVDLFHLGSTSLNETRAWNLFYGRAGADESCDSLRPEVFGTDTTGKFAFSDCTRNEHRLCRLGDLTSKCGPLQFVGGRARLCCTDNQLGSVPFSTLFNPANNFFLSVKIIDMQVIDQPIPAPEACATLEKVLPQVGRVKVVSPTLYGDFIFYQNSPLDRTFVRPYIQGLRRRNIELQIRTNAVTDKQNCSAEALGPILSKPGSPVFGRPLGSIKTGDSVLIGNLAPKVPLPAGSQTVLTPSSSQYLPLFGQFSIIGHSLVVVERTDSGPVYLACNTIKRVTDYPGGMFASISGFQEVDKPQG